jgi:phosphoadenosine phosphosulfate reductase
VLKTVDAWITGLRKEQSVTRQDMALFEYDQTHKILKVNPLIHWDYETVRNVIKDEKIPYNALHDQGYPSIGCEPCTRAIKEGEDIRAGRWWWEAADQKECGLHSNKDNK